MSHSVDNKQHATIIAITGLPCTGKSMLAAQLQQQLEWPVLAKDTIKETLFDSLGWRDRAWSRRLSDASFELLFTLLTQVVRSRGQVIVEANFRLPEHAQRFASLRQDGELRLAQVVCIAEGKLLQQRFLERAQSGRRHTGHVDLDSYAELAPQLALGVNASARLPNAEMTMEWDTTQTDRDLTALLVQLRAML